MVIGCKKNNEYACCTIPVVISTNDLFNILVCNTDTEGNPEYKIKDTQYTAVYSKQKFECACVNKQLDNLTVGITIQGEFPNKKMLAYNLLDYCLKNEDE